MAGSLHSRALWPRLGRGRSARVVVDPRRHTSHVAPASRRNLLLRLTVTVGVFAALLSPQSSGAQEPDPAETERQLEEVRAQRGEAQLEVDALMAQDAEIEAAISTLETNVATQQAELEEAERALTAAEAEVETATANVE